VISQEAMICRLSDDVRGRLRGCQDDALIGLAVQQVWAHGDTCADWAMREAVALWLAAGAPDPQLVPRCMECAAALPVGWHCEACDLTYGSSWAERGLLLAELERFPPLPRAS
jgi:hypothetical protein